MSQRASAEIMVRMLEAETTQQRHDLAEERAKVAKLEALVLKLEVIVQFYTLHLIKGCTHLSRISTKPLNCRKLDHSSLSLVRTNTPLCIWIWN